MGRSAILVQNHLRKKKHGRKNLTGENGEFINSAFNKEVNSQGVRRINPLEKGCDWGRKRTSKESGG